MPTRRPRHVFEVCTKRFGVPLNKLTNNMLFGKVRFACRRLYPCLTTQIFSWCWHGSQLQSLAKGIFVFEGTKVQARRNAWLRRWR